MACATTRPASPATPRTISAHSRDTAGQGADCSTRASSSPVSAGESSTRQRCRRRARSRRSPSLSSTSACSPRPRSTAGPASRRANPSRRVEAAPQRQRPLDRRHSPHPRPPRRLPRRRLRPDRGHRRPSRRTRRAPMGERNVALSCESTRPHLPCSGAQRHAAVKLPAGSARLLRRRLSPHGGRRGARRSDDCECPR